MTPTRCSPAVCQIERLMKKRRRLSNILLNLDMYERWGGSQDSSMNAELSRAADYSVQNEQARQEIIQLAGRLSPADRRAWAEAHLALLQDFLADCRADGQNTSTEEFVAREESTGWQEVASGTADLVQQNIFYIRYKNELYQQYFGMDYRG